MNKLVNKTTLVTLSGQITFENIKDVISIVDEANENGVIESVRLRLVSAGGKLYAALALYDVIIKSKKPVNIIATGYCASSAILVLQAAKRRFSTTNTIFCLHAAEFSLDKSTFQEIESMYSAFQRNNNRFLELSLDRSGIDIVETEKKITQPIFLTAVEALKFGPHGLIDEIL